MSVSIVKYGLARSRNHAFNILIKKVLLKLREVGFWENMQRRFEELEEDFKLSHSGLNKLIAGDREHN
jgi:hypothetical protein